VGAVFSFQWALFLFFLRGLCFLCMCMGMPVISQALTWHLASSILGSSFAEDVDTERGVDFLCHVQILDSEHVTLQAPVLGQVVSQGTWHAHFLDMLAGSALGCWLLVPLFFVPSLPCSCLCWMGLLHPGQRS